MVVGFELYYGFINFIFLVVYMKLNLGEYIVMEFYSKALNMEIYPLKTGTTPDTIVQSLSQRGYDVSCPKREYYPALYKTAHIFQNGSELLPNRIPDDIFLVSKMEQLRALLRYRHQSDRDSVKIEGIDPEIKDALLPFLTD